MVKCWLHVTLHTVKVNLLRHSSSLYSVFQVAILSHQQRTWSRCGRRCPFRIHALHLHLSSHGLCAVAVWLIMERLCVHTWDFMSASWLQIVQQNGPWATQPVQWGLAGSLRTNWQPCTCGCVMLASVKAEKTRESKRVIKMQSELRDRERKNNTGRKVGCNLHTHPSTRAWHRGFVAFEVYGNPWEKAKGEKKTKMAL